MRSPGGVSLPVAPQSRDTRCREDPPGLVPLFSGLTASPPVTCLQFYSGMQLG
jgi:hypothetical protein